MQPTPTTQSTYNPTDEMKRLLDIVELTDRTIDALLKLDLASGVDVKISVEDMDDAK